MLQLLAIKCIPSRTAVHLHAIGIPEYNDSPIAPTLSHTGQLALLEAGKVSHQMSDPTHTLFFLIAPFGHNYAPPNYGFIADIPWRKLMEYAFPLPKNYAVSLPC